MLLSVREAHRRGGLPRRTRNGAQERVAHRVRGHGCEKSPVRADTHVPFYPASLPAGFWVTDVHTRVGPPSGARISTAAVSVSTKDQTEPGGRAVRGRGHCSR